MALMSLANEVLLCIADHLEKERDISALARSSYRLYSLLNSYLYRGNARQHGNSALMWAVGCSRIATLKVAIAKGGDVDATSTETRQQTPFDCARTFSRLAKLVISVIPNMYEGMTPLQMAIYRRDEPIATLLLDSHASFRKADLNNVARCSILHIASFHGMVSIVKRLLENGAKVEARDCEGRTPLHFSVAMPTRGYWRGNIETVAVLLVYGANADTRDKRKETPKHLAEQNTIRLVGKLLEKGVDAFLQFGQLDDYVRDLVEEKNRDKLKSVEIAREKLAKKKERKTRERAAKKIAMREEEEMKQRAEDERRIRLERDAKEREEEAEEQRYIEASRVQKQEAIRKNWSAMKERATQTAETSAPAEIVKSVNCSHTSIGWTRKKGKSRCDKCGETCGKFSFQCPDCSSIVCILCKP